MYETVSLRLAHWDTVETKLALTVQNELSILEIKFGFGKSWYWLMHLTFNEDCSLQFVGVHKKQIFEFLFVLNPPRHIAFWKAKVTLNQPEMMEKMIAETSLYNTI